MNVAVVKCADDPQIEVGGDIVTVSGLCDSPARLVEELDRADGMVLLLHEKRYDLASVQKALRSMEVDPLGVQLLEVASGRSAKGIPLAVAGLEARAAAFRGSEPENAKPELRGEVTRRGLFQIPQPVYVAAPMVDHNTCAAAEGCRACADVCPRDAYRWHQGRIHFNKDICEPCGRCVTICPTEAIENPAATPSMLEAQINALLAGSTTPLGIRFVCSRATKLDRLNGWQDIEVPCTGMVRGTWLITTLLMGAGGVSVAACSESGCPFEFDDATNIAVEFARSGLAAAGLDTNMVQTRCDVPIATPIARLPVEGPFTRAGDLATMLALDDLAENTLAFTHEGAGHGVVAIDSAACTLCAQCAQTCPTGAIAAAYDGERVTLSFAAASCTNCSQCVIACPEIARGAIRVSSTVDTGLLRSARFALNEGTVLVCESCGKPIAPSSMMERIGELLGDDFGDTMSYLSRRCLDCRGLS